MEKKLILTMVIALFLGITSGGTLQAKKLTPGKKVDQNAAAADSKGNSFTPFYIFMEDGSAMNHFSPSGWMGDTSDLILDTTWKKNTNGSNTVIKLSYTPKGPQGWAGVFWQEPANNWGTIKGGFNLTGATKFVMYIRGDKGGERIGGFSIGGVLDGKVSSDTDKISIPSMVLTTDWKKIEVGLKGRDLSNIISGLSFSMGKGDNPDGATFYLDKVHFE